MVVDFPKAARTSKLHEEEFSRFLHLLRLPSLHGYRIDRVKPVFNEWKGTWESHGKGVGRNLRPFCNPLYLSS